MVLNFLFSSPNRSHTNISSITMDETIQPVPHVSFDITPNRLLDILIMAGGKDKTQSPAQIYFEELFSSRLIHYMSLNKNQKGPEINNMINTLKQYIATNSTQSSPVRIISKSNDNKRYIDITSDHDNLYLKCLGKSLSAQKR